MTFGTTLVQIALLSITNIYTFIHLLFSLRGGGGYVYVCMFEE